MARDKKKKTQAADRRRPIKKKTSILSTESIDWVDYKDVNLLRRFMSERAKIRARRVTGNNAQQQRAVARAIRIAREMALLPYSVRQVTQRSRGGRRDRERDRPMEAPPEMEAPREMGAPPGPGGAEGAGNGGAGTPAEGETAGEGASEVASDAGAAEAGAVGATNGEDES
jgi:small subunit ribosomal protein S18